MTNLVVTPAQVIAAQLQLDLADELGETVSPLVRAIAAAQPTPEQSGNPGVGVDTGAAPESASLISTEERFAELHRRIEALERVKGLVGRGYTESVEDFDQVQVEEARLAKQAERAAAREAHAKAREPYEGLTKAELSDQLAERGLPKNGNVDELIDRLVSADSK